MYNFSYPILVLFSFSIFPVAILLIVYCITLNYLVGPSLMQICYLWFFNILLFLKMLTLSVTSSIPIMHTHSPIFLALLVLFNIDFFLYKILYSYFQHVTLLASNFNRVIIKFFLLFILSIFSVFKWFAFLTISIFNSLVLAQHLSMFLFPVLSDSLYIQIFFHLVESSSQSMSCYLYSCLLLKSLYHWSHNFTTPEYITPTSLTVYLHCPLHIIILFTMKNQKYCFSH